MNRLSMLFLVLIVASAPLIAATASELNRATQPKSGHELSPEVRAAISIGLQNAFRQMHRVLELLKDRERVLIMCQLSHGERSIAELESMTGLKAKRVSLHLQRLHDDGLVLTRRFADKLYFMPVGDEEQRLMQELYDMLCTPIVQQCRASNDPAY